MIDRAAIEQILAQYTKHGWTLRRVLMTNELASGLVDPTELFGETEIIKSDLDAVWFSRSSRPGTTAWELRHLGPLPYALVEGIPADLTPDDAGSLLHGAEERMRSTIRARRAGN